MRESHFVPANSCVYQINYFFPPELFTPPGRVGQLEGRGGVLVPDARFARKRPSGDRGAVKPHARKESGGGPRRPPKIGEGRKSGCSSPSESPENRGPAHCDSSDDGFPQSLRNIYSKSHARDGGRNSQAGFGGPRGIGRAKEWVEPTVAVVGKGAEGAEIDVSDPERPVSRTLSKGRLSSEMGVAGLINGGGVRS